MKPSDHPDYFRLPPPEGRSRESSIELDADGRFWHEGERVVHPGMARAFASWVSRHPENGRYVLNNGYDWVYLKVHDAPFFIDQVRAPPAAAGAECLLLRLTTGEEEPLEPELLKVDQEGVLRTRVRRGEFGARFTQAGQLTLAPFLTESAPGHFSLTLGNRAYSITMG